MALLSSNSFVSFNCNKYIGYLIVHDSDVYYTDQTQEFICLMPEVILRCPREVMHNKMGKSSMQVYVHKLHVYV